MIHRDEVRNFLCVSLDNTRRLVEWAMPMSALVARLMDVSVLPRVACLWEPGMPSFGRLLTLQVMVLMVKTCLLHLMDDIMIRSCTLETAVRSHSGAPWGTAILLTCMVLSNCSRMASLVCTIRAEVM